MKENYDQFLNRCYRKYKESWCKEHGYSLDEFNESDSELGECFVCFEEFENNEFQDGEYMKGLLNEDELVAWNERDELKRIMIDYRINIRYELQRQGLDFTCPRCGREMDHVLAHNALSRRKQIYICSPCGTLEAMEFVPFAKVPCVSLTNWFIATPIEE